MLTSKKSAEGSSSHSHSHSQSSIVPVGFALTAHPVFSQYRRPQIAVAVTFRSTTKEDGDDSDEETGNLKRASSSSTDENTSASDLDPIASLQEEEEDSSKDSKPSKKSKTRYKRKELCAICLESACGPATLVLCQHSFCKTCIYTWFKTNINCPLCKAQANYFVTFRQLEDSDAEEAQEMVLLRVQEASETIASKKVDKKALNKAKKVHIKRFKK